MNTPDFGVAVSLVSMTTVLSGSMFVWAGVSNLRDPVAAGVAVLDYRLTPPILATGVAAFVGILEVTCGIGMMLVLPVALPLGILLLAGLTGLTLSARARGLDIDCHCGGEGEPLTAWTVRRNASLLVAACVAAAVVSATAVPAWTPLVAVAPLPILLLTGLALSGLLYAYVIARVADIVRALPARHVCGGAR